MPFQQRMASFENFERSGLILWTLCSQELSPFVRLMCVLVQEVISFLQVARSVVLFDLSFSAFEFEANSLT